MKDRFEVFVTSITSISSEIRRIKLEGGRDLGLKGSTVMILYELGANPAGLTGAELSARCEMDKAAVSRAVRQLQEDGLVRVEETGSGRYRAKLLLTEKGLSISDRLNRKIEHMVSIVSDDMNETERSEFYNHLQTITEKLRNYSSAEN